MMFEISISYIAISVAQIENKTTRIDVILVFNRRSHRQLDIGLTLTRVFLYRENGKMSKTRTVDCITISIL